MLMITDTSDPYGEKVFNSLTLLLMITDSSEPYEEKVFNS
jgi:hypothetical protein